MSDHGRPTGSPTSRPPGPSPHVVGAVLLVLVGAALLVAAGYVPGVLTDDVALRATVNGVLRLLGFGSLAAAAVLLVAGRARREGRGADRDDGRR